ncbi:MAG: ATP-binding cassette domain-containing protein [Acidobacteria bacterium]|nr:ATP-binding cassette domain-containing protein [Acidobacteriota bacterium]
MQSQPPLLDMRRISVMRGDRIILDDIDLRIGVGEHVAILGPNGCGKSTLIKTVTRELYPLLREGSALRLLGRERWDIFELRSAMGIVTNDLMTDCSREITGEELVLSGFFSSIGVWPHQSITDAMRGRARQILTQLEVEHLARQPVNEMSSGEARRILIARALVHEPKALVLDEPTTSLDVFAQHEVRQMIRRLAQSGVGMILVTHHLADIPPEVERVILMRDGRILADGAKADLLRPEALTGLFGIAVEVTERDGFYHLW